MVKKSKYNTPADQAADWMRIYSMSPDAIRRHSDRLLQAMLASKLPTDFDKHGRRVKGDIDDLQETDYEDPTDRWLRIERPDPPEQDRKPKPEVPPRTEGESMWHTEQNRGQSLRRGGTRYGKDLANLFAETRFHYHYYGMRKGRQVMVVHKVIYAVSEKQSLAKLKDDVKSKGCDDFTVIHMTREDPVKEEKFGGPISIRTKRLYNDADSVTGAGPYHVCRQRSQGDEVVKSFATPTEVTRFLRHCDDKTGMFIKRDNTRYSWREWARARRVHEIIAGVGETEYSRDQHGAFHGSKFIKPRKAMLGYDDIPKEKKKFFGIRPYVDPDKLAEDFPAPNLNAPKYEDVEFDYFDDAEESRNSDPDFIFAVHEFLNNLVVADDAEESEDVKESIEFNHDNFPATYDLIDRLVGEQNEQTNDRYL